MVGTAIILAAGLGTRMRSRAPKALLKLGGKPLLWHLLRSAEAAFERIVVVIGPDMPELAALAAPHAVVVQEERLGTAHAALAAAEKFGSGPVAVLYADNPLIRPETISALMGRLAGGGPALSLLAMRPPVPDGYGIVVLNGTPRGTAKIVEWADATEAERAGGLCNAGGLCAAGPDLRRWLGRVGNDNAKREYYLTDIVALAAREGARIIPVEELFEELRGINTPGELAAAEASLQQRLRAAAFAAGAFLTAPETVFLAADTKLGPDAIVGPYVVFGPGVEVEAGAEIQPFCHLERCRIGAEAVVGPFARLRPGTELGEGAHVGNFVELKATTLGAGAKANHLSYLGDAAIGEASNIGAGTIICNYDGFAKHRTEIGARAFIGSDAVLVAPVTVGAGAFIAAGSVITKNVAPDAMAFARAQQKEQPEGARKFRNWKKRARLCAEL